MIVTDADHIREMIAGGKAKALPVHVSREFGAFIEGRPFYPSGASLDWSKMPPHSAVEWYEKTDDELVQWARTLRLGGYGHVALWYNDREPCLLTGFEFGVANLDTLTWGAPGPRYLFGVAVRDGNYRYSFPALLEVTGGPLLRGVL